MRIDWFSHAWRKERKKELTFWPAVAVSTGRACVQKAFCKYHLQFNEVFLSQYCEEAFQSSVLNYRTQHFKTLSILSCLLRICFQQCVVKLGGGGWQWGVSIVWPVLVYVRVIVYQLPVQCKTQRCYESQSRQLKNEGEFFFSALCTVRWPIHASMHCLWQW